MPLRVNEATLRGKPWFLMPLRGKGKQSSAQRLHGEVKLSNRLPPNQKIRAMQSKTKFSILSFAKQNLVLLRKTFYAKP